MVCDATVTIESKIYLAMMCKNDYYALTYSLEAYQVEMVNSNYYLLVGDVFIG